MLDAFLEVVCEHEKKASAYQNLVADMTRLPKRELQALADGRSKLAGYFGDGEDWLEKFQDTPLHEQALVLEQECLENQIAKEQKRLENAEQEDLERAVRDEEYRAEDAIRLKKRIMDLELNKWKLEQSGVAAPEEGGEEELEEEIPEEALEEETEEEAPEEELPEEEAAEEDVEEEASEEEPVDVKAAAVRMRFKLAMRKQALGAFGAALQGGVKALGAAGRSLGNTAATAATAGQLGGMAGAGRIIGKDLTRGAQQVGQWAAANPTHALAAGGIAAGGIGAAGLGAGALAGRASKRQVVVR